MQVDKVVGDEETGNLPPPPPLQNDKTSTKVTPIELRL